MHFTLTKQWGRIDFRVWLSLIALVFISLVLFGYKLATNVDCASITLKAVSSLSHANEKPNTFFVNEQITFSGDLVSNAQKIDWDFGDKTEVLSGKTVAHTFTKEGNYLVTATTNGKCTESINIRILQSNTSTDNMAPDLNPIVSGDVTSLGEETTFNTSTVSKSYTWSVDELPNLGKVNTQSAKFIFTKAGSFTISLLLEGGKIFKKTIQVNDPLAQSGHPVPLPPKVQSDIPPAPTVIAPLPEKKKDETADEHKEDTGPSAKVYEQLPTPAIQAMLEGVTKGNKNIEDFSNILCNGAGTKVMANNQPTTFAALCNELKEKKGLPLLKRRRKIESVKVVRDEKNGNCVNLLYVDYR